jgi:hypothetical protein
VKDYLTLEERLEQTKVDLASLIAKWRSSRAHTYSSENAEHYRGFDAGQLRAAEDVEALLRALAKQQGGEG